MHVYFNDLTRMLIYADCSDGYETKLTIMQNFCSNERLPAVRAEARSLEVPY